MKIIDTMYIYKRSTCVLGSIYLNNATRNDKKKRERGNLVKYQIKE